MNRKSILFVLVILSICSGKGQGIVWNKKIFSTGSPYSGIQFLDKDSLGNTFALGGYYFGGFDDACGIFLCKYDSSGNQLWLDTIGSFEFENVAKGISVVGRAVYITGYCTWRRNQINFSGTTLYAPSPVVPSMFLAKYDLYGNLIWVKQFDNAKGLGLDAYQNKLYIIGWQNQSSSQQAFFLARYDTSGTQDWMTPVSNIETTGLSVSDANNIFVAVTSWQSQSIKKYNRSGASIWSKNCQGTLLTLKADKNGNCYITGTFYGGASFDAHGVSSPYGNTFQYFMAKLDSGGHFDWAITPPDSLCFGAVVPIDSSVIVAIRDYPTTNYKNGLATYSVEGNLQAIDHLSVFSSPYTIGQFLAFSHSFYLSIREGGQYGNAYLAKVSSNVNTGASVEDNMSNNPSFHVYPNPTDGIFQINYYSANEKRITVIVRNPEGQVIYQEVVSIFNKHYSKFLDLSSKSKGVYLIEIIGIRRKSVQKIVID